MENVRSLLPVPNVGGRNTKHLTEEMKNKQEIISRKKKLKKNLEMTEQTDRVRLRLFRRLVSDG